MSKDNETQRRIAERAYEIYLARGGQDGLDEDDWLKAEREITGEPYSPDGPGPPDAGPNVPIDSGGVGAKSAGVFPDVDGPGEEQQPLPPPGESQP